MMVQSDDSQEATASVVVVEHELGVLGTMMALVNERRERASWCWVVAGTDSEEEYSPPLVNRNDVDAVNLDVVTQQKQDVVEPYEVVYPMEVHFEVYQVLESIDAEHVDLAQKLEVAVADLVVET